MDLHLHKSSTCSDIMKEKKDDCKKYQIIGWEIIHNSNKVGNH